MSNPPQGVISILGRTITTTEITDLTIVDADVSGTADIGKGKISSTGTWANAEIANLPTLGTLPSPARQTAITNTELAGSITNSKLLDLPTLGTLPSPPRQTLIVNAEIKAGDFENITGIGVQTQDLVVDGIAVLAVGTGTRRAQFHNMAGATLLGIRNTILETSQSVEGLITHIVAPTNIGPTDGTVEKAFRIFRDGTAGTKFNQVADFQIGSYATTGINAQAQLTLRLNNGAVHEPDTDVMTWRADGNVGIGTTQSNQPNRKLRIDVSEPSTILGFNNLQGMGINQTDTTVDNWSTLEFLAGGAIATTIATQYKGSGEGDLVLAARGSSGFAERVRITGNGNFGIGINPPTEKLHVVGNGLITGNITVNGATTPALTFTGNQVLHHTVIGITANTTQTQGQTPLTGTFNEINTVANVNDVVTLPTAVTGLEIIVDNDGVNTLQIFPASGDNLGNGVDVSATLEAGGIITFNAIDTTNWDRTSSTEIFHAEIHDEDNTDAYVINDAGGDEHVYHTNGIVAGDLSGWTFDAGGAGTSFPIASIADAGGGDITVTTTGSHLLEIGDIISQTNLADAAYVGRFIVKTVPTGTTYTVTATFTATGTGTMDQAATLDVNDIAVGAYKITWQASATSASNNETFDFFLHKNATDITGSKTRRKFGTATDFGSFGGQALVDVVSGDKISYALANQDSAGNVTIRDFSLILIKL